MRQIDKVLDAYVAGSRTVPEVSAITGLSVKHCSAYSRELVRIGKLKTKGSADASFRTAPVGRSPYWYEPIQGAR